MKKEIWIREVGEHETDWIWARDLQDVADTIQDYLGEEATPYPEGFGPRFVPGEEVELEWSFRGPSKWGRIISFLGGWTDGEVDLEAYEVAVEEKEIWVWHRREHETSWIWAINLEDAADIIQGVLEGLEGGPTPYPEGWPPQFAPGEVVELDRGLRGRICSFLRGWSNGEEDMEVYEVVEEDP